MPSPLFLDIYPSLCAEVDRLCELVGSKHAKTLITVDSFDSRVYSAVCSELQYKGIAFSVNKSHGVHEINEFWRMVLMDWVSWQTTQDISAFAQFASDLNILSLITFEDLKDLNKLLSKFLGRYLNTRYEFLQPYLPSNVAKIIAPFDILKDSITVEDLLCLYEKLWSQVGEKHISEIRSLFLNFDKTLEFSTNEILKILYDYLLTSKACSDIFDKTLVSVSLITSYIPNSYEQIFYLYSEQAKNFSNKKFIYSLAQKYKTHVVCCEDEMEDCISCLGDIFDIHSKVHSETLAFNSQDLTKFYQTKLAYTSRRDAETHFDNYSYMLDPSSLDSAPCKGVENMLRNPRNFFYKNVLTQQKFNDFDLKKLKKIFVGTLVHDMLNISQNHCSLCPNLDEFYELIDKKFHESLFKIKKLFQNDSAISQRMHESLNFSKFVAYKLAKQIVSCGYKYIATEIMVPQNLEIKFAQKPIKLSGRVDCILSNQPFSLDKPSDVTLNIFDFKIGTYELLSSDKFPKQLEDYTGVQVMLYGFIFKQLGFKNVNVQIMRADKKTAQPLNVNSMISECDWLFKNLEQIFSTGIIGENIHTFAENYDDLPLSESPIDNSTIALKRQKF